MPVGRDDALPEEAEPEEAEPDDEPVPAEPAVLPLEPEGVDPTVPLLALPDDDVPGAWFLTVLLLTSQHCVALAPDVLEPVPVPVPCAFAATAPTTSAAAESAAMYLM